MKECTWCQGDGVVADDGPPPASGDRLTAALAGWEDEHKRFMDHLFNEKGFFHNPECPICRRIKELETMT